MEKYLSENPGRKGARFLEGLKLVTDNALGNFHFLVFLLFSDHRRWSSFWLQNSFLQSHNSSCHLHLRVPSAHHDWLSLSVPLQMSGEEVWLTQVVLGITYYPAGENQEEGDSIVQIWLLVTSPLLLVEVGKGIPEKGECAPQHRPSRLPKDVVNCCKWGSFG